MNHDSQFDTSRPRRRGLHRLFHTSKADSYASEVIGVGFVVLALGKAYFDWCILEFLSPAESFQIALLCGIYGLLAKHYYQRYEAKYDRPPSD